MSAGSSVRQHIISIIINQSVSYAVKEPVGLMCQDGKRPDGTTILPWSRGKPLAWDLTVPDTYADAHVANSARQAGAAATQEATNKTSKYSQLASTHIFYLAAI